MGEILLNGKYDNAKVFTENIDELTVGQITRRSGEQVKKSGHL